MLLGELQDDFSAAHCISVNDDKDAEKNQILLNSLEDKDNPYRAIFEVKKLDEGWDVLNLFDIVRLYETRQSGGKKISSATISEAQLIGRGSRYCPFKIEDEQPKFQRKFDDNASCELRICETLYYHCQNDSRYISELQAALREIGLDLEKVKRCEYKLKENFKQDELYKSGVIFLNDRKEKTLPATCELSPAIRDKIYSFNGVEIVSGTEKLLLEDDENNKRVEIRTVRRTVKEIANINFAIVNKALMKFPIYKFYNLKKIFPALQSTKSFVGDEKYLTLALLILILSILTGTAFSESFRDKLLSLPDVVSVDEIIQIKSGDKTPFAEKYLVIFEQPLDWNGATSETFTQRIEIGFISSEKFISGKHGIMGIS